MSERLGLIVESRSAVERDARARVEMWLGFASFIIWFVVALGLVLIFELTRSGRPSRIILAGSVAFLVAALPWFAYGRLVRGEKARLVARQGRG